MIRHEVLDARKWRWECSILDEVAREITARWPRDRSAHLEPHTYHMKSHSYKLRLLTMTTTYMCQGRARGRCPGVLHTGVFVARSSLVQASRVLSTLKKGEDNAGIG